MILKRHRFVQPILETRLKRELASAFPEYAMGYTLNIYTSERDVVLIEVPEEVHALRVRVVMDHHDATPVLYQGVPVTNADDVDRITIRRIRDLLAPGRPEDVQVATELRWIKDALLGHMPRNQALEQEQLVSAIRDEGRTFKAAQGWG